MTKTKDDAATGFDPMAPWAALQTAGLAPGTVDATAWTETMQQYAQEMSRFLTLRFEKDVEMQKRLLACRDSSDLRDLQAQFFQDALDDYQAETARMMEIGRSFLDKAQRRD